jgi:hypothetical protein
MPSEAETPDLALIEATARKINPGRSEDHIKSVALDALSIFRALSAASAVRSEGVEVRALEWDHHGPFMAMTPFGLYEVGERPAANGLFTLWFNHVVVGRYDTRKAALVGAQEHYTNAVLSAITSPVQTREDGVLESSTSETMSTMLTVRSARGDEYVIDTDKLAATVAHILSEVRHEERMGWSLELGFYQSALNSLRGAALLSQPEPKGDKT